MIDKFALTTRTNVATQLRTLAELVESGTIKNYQITQDTNSITFIADSADGRTRVIKNKNQVASLRRESTEIVEKPESPKERRKIVSTLHLEGKSQTEIAKRTMSSQKTVSNDIRWLKERGKL